MNDWKDPELGMGRGITRRDFLNGVALTAGAAMLSSDLLAAADMHAGAGAVAWLLPSGFDRASRQPPGIVRRGPQPARRHLLGAGGSAG